MAIECIPAGWDFVGVGRVKQGDFYVTNEGAARKWTESRESTFVNYVIIRKIEKPKQFRSFANAAEYMPNWGKPVDWKLNDVSPCNCAVVSANVSFVWVAFGEAVQRFDWEQAFEKIWFADGTPFGVEVTE